MTKPPTSARRRTGEERRLIATFHRRFNLTHGWPATFDLPDLGVTPEHDDTQQCLDVLAARVDAATIALLSGETPERQAALRVAVAAFDAARRGITDAAYEAWMDEVAS